jgi:hypothetical protein
MSYNFREMQHVLGAATAVDTSNAPGQLSDLPLVQSYEFICSPTLGAASTSQTLFVAPKTSGSRANFGTYKVAYVIVSFGTASSSGTMQIEKATSTQAIASGTNVLTGTMSLAGTANTPVEGTLSSNPGTLTMAGGDRLNVILGGTLTSLANCVVTIGLQRVA